MSNELLMPSSHLILWCPFSFCLQSFPVSRIFQWVISLHQMTKRLELQIEHQYFQWVFRVDFPSDWLVWCPCCQRNFKKFLRTFQNFLQHHSLKASILWHSSLWAVQLSQPYEKTEKTIALTIQTFCNCIEVKLKISNWIEKSRNYTIETVVEWLFSKLDIQSRNEEKSPPKQIKTNKQKKPQENLPYKISIRSFLEEWFFFTFLSWNT